jgi:hypothetical protein
VNTNCTYQSSVIVSCVFVEADADPESDQREPAAAWQRGDFLALVFLVGNEHPAAESEQGRCGDVVGDSADRGAEAVSEQQADDGHHHLERRHQQARLQPLLRGQALNAECGRDGEGVETERQHEEDQLEHAPSLRTAP